MACCLLLIVIKLVFSHIPAISLFIFLVTMDIFNIQSHIEAIAQNASIYNMKHFDERSEAIDFIEFHVIEGMDTWLQKTAQLTELRALKHRAEEVMASLAAVDQCLFQQLQSVIKTGACTGKAFSNLIREYVNFNTDADCLQKLGYDNLDLFVNNLFTFETIPTQTKDLEPDMVYYQKTPARIVFELVEKIHFPSNAVFVDLGAGLGQVAILVNLLAGITTIGIEFEPSLCAYATRCAVALQLSNVTFVNEDVRESELSTGTVFFMFTPFKGEIMRTVLKRLREQALSKQITIITYGPCTAQVATQNWLTILSPEENNDYYQPRIFTSNLKL